MRFEDKSIKAMSATARQLAYTEAVSLYRYIQRAYPSFERFAEEHDICNPSLIQGFKSGEKSWQSRVESAVAILFEIRNNPAYAWWIEKNFVKDELPEVDKNEWNRFMFVFGYCLTDATRLVYQDNWRDLDACTTQAERDGLDTRLEELKEEAFDAIRDTLEDRMDSFMTALFLGLMSNEKKTVSCATEFTRTRQATVECIRIFYRKFWFVFADTIGAYKFKWHTQEDDKVRPSHAELDRVTMTIEDPRLQRLFDYNCRCWLEVKGYYAKK